MKRQREVVQIVQRSNVLRGLLLFLGLQFYSICYTQTIVNTEKLFNSDSTRFKFSSELLGSVISGNASVFLLEYSANAAFQQGKNQIMLLSGGEYINEEKQIVSNSHFGQFRYSYILSDWITPYGFYQIQSNEILLLRRRQLAGIGNRMTLFRVLKHDSLEVIISRLSLGCMLEEELLNRDKLPVDEKVYTNYFRGNLNFVLSFAISENISFINTTYYQPYFKNFKDYRLLNETNILFEITERLSFSVDFEIRYDNDPPKVLKNNDINSNFGLLFQI